MSSRKRSASSAAKDGEPTAKSARAPDERARWKQERELLAVSPIDGRYAKHTKSVSDYFSEFALFKYRVMVEVEYFVALSEHAQVSVVPAVRDADVSQHVNALRELYERFSLDDCARVKEIERTTNHDIKAVEYFIKERIDAVAPSLVRAKEFVHFGLTSQDVNNTAIPLMMQCFLREQWLPTLERSALEPLRALAAATIDVAMLARTHGQPATPTRVGKELLVFVERLVKERERLEQLLPLECKFGGAVGALNAHVVAFPGGQWHVFADAFAERLGLRRQQFTTQVAQYDQLAAAFDSLRRTCTILVDLCRDVWMYISMEYFKQRVVAGEVGSSAMPHKVNPIDFENAEGNLGVASALLGHFSAKLPISRLQRDLSDSTVLRNVGVPLAHMLVALGSMQRGLGKLTLNKQRLRDDLDANYQVVAEALQTILRREGYEKPYEALKELTRTGAAVSAESVRAFVEGLQGISDDVKREMMAVTPHNFIGELPATMP